jgi:hypothetical protein
MKQTTKQIKSWSNYKKPKKPLKYIIYSLMVVIIAIGCLDSLKSTTGAKNYIPHDCYTVFINNQATRVCKNENNQEIANITYKVAEKVPTIKGVVNRWSRENKIVIIK